MFAPRRPAAPVLLFAAALLAVATASADGPADNVAEKVRPIPPKGIDLPPADAEDIKKGLAELQGLIKSIGKHDLLPDVEIYEKAVRYAVDYKEVFDKKGVPAVKKVLAAGLDRAKQLKAGQHPWSAQTGYVLRGYRSMIDGSAQPYGLFVPKEYDFAGKTRHRLDVWWHGRGETLSEVNFMANPQNASGIIPVPGQFILYPYGRYCNANKFAGEVDTFECLGWLRDSYRIDWNRIVARGFSMGGAACWQYAVHFPTFWCAAAPGAGFSETADFLKVFQNEPVNPPWYEQKLWRMYDATDYAANLFNLPTVAYSGEIDRQKQAADMMEKAMAKEGLKLVHIIGPKTAHAYEKGAKEEVNKRIDAIVAKGKPIGPRKELRLVTYTLRYNTCAEGLAGIPFTAESAIFERTALDAQIRITGLRKHWERAEVRVTHKDGKYAIETKGVTGLGVYVPGGTAPPAVLDGQELKLAQPPAGFGQIMGFKKGDDGKWVQGTLKGTGLRKAPGLQGPIDDAFMDSFVMVTPSGTAMNEKVGTWAAGEMKHAVEHWRKQFRGDAQVKKDIDITKYDIEISNLVLWGDPKSNAILAKIADKLPIKWTENGVAVGDKTYDAATHVPLLIYPNPLNPSRYVVLNSGFTYREYDYLNNARQVSKLPDYAVIDTTTPPNSRYPGKVVRAGFFGEKWELLPNDGK